MKNETPVSSFRLPQETLEKINALTLNGKRTKTEAVIFAVNVAYGEKEKH